MEISRAQKPLRVMSYLFSSRDITVWDLSRANSFLSSLQSILKDRRAEGYA
jgi:hypothetical protein